MFLLDRLTAKYKLPEEGARLAGRDAPLDTAENHFVNGNPLKGPYPEGSEEAYFGMGCFWGIERLFWQRDGVWVTSVGYQGGTTPNPTYREVCTGLTGHNETVHVVFDPAVVSYGELLKMFWENHDPTQGMRQGNDVGTQYRSGLYVTSSEQKAAAQESLEAYGSALAAKGVGRITTEIVDAPPYYYAEEYHQQYLAKNPGGYCNMRGTGVACSIPQGTGETA